MPLELHPMTRDDLVAFEEIKHAAFAGSLQRLFFPDGLTDSLRAHGLATAQKQWDDSAAAAAAAGHPPSLHYLKVIDTDRDDRVVGVSKWNIYPRGRRVAELAADEAPAAGPPPPPGLNTAATEAFKKALQATKRALFGTAPFMILQILVTHPAHFRRGVGALHLRWGQEQADALGVPMYLEASAMGRPLYERWGYVVDRTLPFDARDYGMEDPMFHYAMVRPAQKAGATRAAGEEATKLIDVKLSNGSAAKGHVVNGTAMNGTAVNGTAIDRTVANGIPVNGHA